MSLKKPNIIITDSNGQKQSDSYQDDIFINTSEQQGKLFHFMGNTSLANQFFSNANK